MMLPVAGGHYWGAFPRTAGGWGSCSPLIEKMVGCMVSLKIVDRLLKGVAGPDA
jgi:hypothetical protein